MAKTCQELFLVFAARVAELLRERFELDPESLVRTNPADLTIEGLVRAGDGERAWHTLTVTSEQLEWIGPERLAQSFVRDYIVAMDAASV